MVGFGWFYKKNFKADTGESFKLGKSIWCHPILLPSITSMCSSHHRARLLVCWISVNKDVLFELHWLFQLPSRSKCGNEWFERQSEGKLIERKIEKDVDKSISIIFCLFQLNQVLAEQNRIVSESKTVLARLSPLQWNMSAVQRTATRPKP